MLIHFLAESYMGRSKLCMANMKLQPADSSLAQHKDQKWLAWLCPKVTKSTYQQLKSSLIYILCHIYLFCTKTKVQTNTLWFYRRGITTISWRVCITVRLPGNQWRLREVVVFTPALFFRFTMYNMLICEF